LEGDPMNTDGLTPFSVLAFLALVGGTGAGAVAVLVALLARNQLLARRLALITAGGWGLYALLLVATSLASKSRLLALNEEKHICEVDCHTSYAITAVRHEGAVAHGGDDRTPRRVSYVVTLRVRFDENTISRHRGMMPLLPGARTIRLIGRDGATYAPSPEAFDALRKCLVPGESYTTHLTFDVPAEIVEPRLYIGADPFLPIDGILIGHENSLFHKTVMFRLDA
ncbi:MAG: hypothetical protein ACREMV_11040, partial [Gemmatimonadales bacterium]